MGTSTCLSFLVPILKANRNNSLKVKHISPNNWPGRKKLYEYYPLIISVYTHVSVEFWRPNCVANFKRVSYTRYKISICPADPGYGVDTNIDTFIAV